MTTCKIDSWWEATVWQRELSSSSVMTSRGGMLGAPRKDGYVYTKSYTLPFSRKSYGTVKQ